MSVGSPIHGAEPPTPGNPVTVSPSPVLGTVATYVVPLVTIMGMIVLLALHDIDQSAGLSIIAALAGVHGGVALATSGH